MDDLAGPTGLLRGMPHPRAWVEALTTVLTTHPSPVTAVTGRLPTGLWAVRLILANSGPFPLQVVLVPHPDQVRITLWSSVWAAAASPPETQHLTLMTVARWLIGVAQQEDRSVVVFLLPPTHVHE